MAKFALSSRTPFCFNCLRRTFEDDISNSLFPFHRQLRGKKKSAKRPTTINVKLLEDMPGYGREGSITPVEPGRMRNTWYPRQRAEYVTAATLQGMKLRDVVAERDFTFGMKSEEEEAPKLVQEAKSIETRIKLLLPQRASEIAEESLPSHIMFYRTPILEPTVQSEEPSNRNRRAATSAAAELDAASEPSSRPAKPQLATIFGSVSTADIAESIKAILAETEEGARVVIGAEDITILPDESEQSEYQENGIEGDRLKALGDFQVEVRVKGVDPVVRTVSVRAQESEPEGESEDGLEE